MSSLNLSSLVPRIDLQVIGNREYRRIIVATRDTSSAHHLNLEGAHHLSLETTQDCLCFWTADVGGAPVQSVRDHLLRMPCQHRLPRSRIRHLPDLQVSRKLGVLIRVSGAEVRGKSGAPTALIESTDWKHYIVAFLDPIWPAKMWAGSGFINVFFSDMRCFIICRWKTRGVIRPTGTDP